MVLKHERLSGVEVGQAVEFDKVLLVVEDDDLRVGSPYLDGVSVKGEVREDGRGEKIIVYKYKSKKGYRRKQGHRQAYMATAISAIDG